MRIPDSFVDELIGKTDMAELVSGYVRLTKKSGKYMYGLCPFHSEKTPSFSVDVEKQIFYCFGCGKGGGAISFVRDVENLPFVDAVGVLAKKVGMTVPEDDGRDEMLGRRTRMLQLNRDAARHFHSMLSSPLGQSARDYLNTRGISKKSVMKFGLGAAPDGWTHLLEAMTQKGYTRKELIEAGLCRHGKKQDSAYDFFRDRLMFPVINIRGDVVAFSGRILGDGEPKYLNSPDTIAFSKSRNMFGLNIAKNSKSGKLILVEGNIDVVMLHQAGFDSAIAPLGTAFTAEQARLIAQYTDNIYIAFDSDQAGQRATHKALPLLEKTGKNVKVIDLGTSSDPDDFIRMRGVDAFTVLIERGEGQTEYRLMTIQKNSNLDTDEGRLSFIAQATDMLSGLPSKPEREIYGLKVAKIVGISPDAIHNEVNKKIKVRMGRTKKDFEKSVTRAKSAIQPISRELRYTNEASAVAEEGVIRCLVRDPLLSKVTSEMSLSREEFTSKFLGGIYQLLLERISEGREVKESLLLSELESNEASQLTLILQKPESLSNANENVRAYIEKMRSEKYKTQTPNEEMLLKIKNLKIESSEVK